MSRLKTTYEKEIVTKLMRKLSLKNENKVYNLIHSSKTQQDINNLLNEYLKEAQNHLKNLKNHPCHSEMLNLLTFFKIRKK